MLGGKATSEKMKRCIQLKSMAYLLNYKLDTDLILLVS
jgi:hypothetical protein